MQGRTSKRGTRNDGNPHAGNLHDSLCGHGGVFSLDILEVLLFPTSQRGCQTHRSIRTHAPIHSQHGTRIVFASWTINDILK